MLAYRIYKKRADNPSARMIAIALFLGLASISAHVEWFGQRMELAILPLGVWILKSMLRRKKDQWQRIRSYAWLGFAGNFIILLLTVASIPLYNQLYPNDDPRVYVSHLEKASLINLYPSTAPERLLHKENLAEQLNMMQPETFYSDEWYEEMNWHPYSNSEQFPYLVVGTSPKWGSGQRPMIYFEDDGKGMLVNTAKKHVYFRSEVDLLKAVESE
ncbi:hypothetical protein [Ammoniphilus oxalaticus]|uniref:hypothetical protein n=1 Tax=Ammoniphilus oxalaticus TaxID=66863 RepID=UPI000E74B1CE|nr:hypothetical protein [Ammoniphilus oxalaticus]